MKRGMLRSVLRLRNNFWKEGVLASSFEIRGGFISSLDFSQANSLRRIDKILSFVVLQCFQADKCG